MKNGRGARQQFVNVVVFTVHTLLSSDSNISIASSAPSDPLRELRLDPDVDSRTKACSEASQFHAESER
ncbi:hypothetical protein CgunFtcFv8_012523 [Champsocephalus gunnari]|uniref:Uncharacterized protein n=1 Tax=Champsocephalus gunnari TaxID=52237 RepID=A0AAN8DS91_CHAGU|nr:hypothetical protein CgunFtcFv8_012523 [Champsocephalus gunnari]